MDPVTRLLVVYLLGQIAEAVFRDPWGRRWDWGCFGRGLLSRSCRTQHRSPGLWGWWAPWNRESRGVSPPQLRTGTLPPSACNAHHKPLSAQHSSHHHDNPSHDKHHWGRWESLEIRPLPSTWSHCPGGPSWGGTIFLAILFPHSLPTSLAKPVMHRAAIRISATKRPS